MAIRAYVGLCRLAHVYVCLCKDMNAYVVLGRVVYGYLDLCSTVTDCVGMPISM